LILTIAHRAAYVTEECVQSFSILSGTAELRSIFEKIDKDGSDGLDQFEITAALESAGVQDTSSWDVTKMFLEADHNRLFMGHLIF